MNNPWHENHREHPPVRGHYIVTASTKYGKMVDLDYWSGNEWRSYSKVRAWMELPEPYSLVDGGGQREVH